jgi:hypothetical protein
MAKGFMPMREISKCRVAAIFIVSFIFFAASGCKVNPISYNTPVNIIRAVLYEYPWLNDQPSGIAVSGSGRIFVGFPRWYGTPAYSVAEVLSDGSLRPFPDADWNLWGEPEAGRPDAHFISVQGMFIDTNDTLWILDSALLNLKSVWPKGAKLVGIDLATSRVTKVIALDDTVVLQNSYLRHVCIDRWSSFAYISDAGSGAIIVTNLETGVSRRVLADDPSTKAEPGVSLKKGGKELRYENGKPVRIHVDGIALDPDSGFLYYHALTARTLYRIHTQYLNNTIPPQSDTGTHVQRLADTGPVDGMVMDGDYNLFLTFPDENAVKRYRIYDGTLVTLAQDDRMSWPDSMSISPDRNLYITDSQFKRLPYFNNGKDERTPPYMVFRVSKIYPQPP